MVCFEAVVLCGGSAKRMKPYLSFNKALAEVSPSTTLLEHQIRWLKEKKADSIILAIDRKTYEGLEGAHPSLLEEVECSVEEEKLGTGGAVKKALSLVERPVFYLMNVDDILISNSYSSDQLLAKVETYPEARGALLMAKTRFPFGVVEEDGPRIKGFMQKPTLDYWVNTGHYALTRNTVEEYFPDRGNFEDSALPRIAEEKRLYHHKLEGEWITVNNMKQLEQAKTKLKEEKIGTSCK